jgi:hypothetical protein
MRARSKWLAGLAAAALMLPLSARADWVKVETPNFVIYTDVDATAARKDARLLEVFDAYLRIRHGLSATTPPRRKLPIYMLRRKRDLKQIYPYIDGDIAGYYSSTTEDTYAVAMADRTDDHVLLHEYVHHFMLQHFPYGYPAWLVEGYAEFFMTAKLTPEYLEIGNYDKNRGHWLVLGEWLPFERMLGIRPGELKRDTQQAMYYAQSWALTHYMMSDPGRSKQLDAYIRAVGAGASPVKAMTDATGMAPAELQKTVHRYLMKGFPSRRFKLDAFPEPNIAVTPVPPAAAAVLLADQRVKGDNGIDAPEDRTDGPVLLADVRRMAGPHAGKREADLALARVEIKLGDMATAERLLAALRTAHPNDAEVLEVSAQARLKAAETAPADRIAALRAQSRAFAGQAYKADPNRYQTLIAYLQGRESVAGYPASGDLEVFRDALTLAPQVATLRVKAAEALVKRQKYAEAAQVLRPLAFSPHPSEIGEAARTLLTAVEALAAAPGSAGVQTRSSPAG